MVTAKQAIEMLTAMEWSRARAAVQSLWILEPAHSFADELMEDAMGIPVSTSGPARRQTPVAVPEPAFVLD